MYVSCTAVNVVYRCNCCVVYRVLPFCTQLSRYNSIMQMTINIIPKACSVIQY